MGGFLHVVGRDLRMAQRHGFDSLLVVAFFVIAVVLFPFGVGPEPNILARIAAGIIWVAALLAAMLSLERLFQTDYEDGSLELLVLSPVSLEIAVLAKVVAHWLTTGVPLIVAAPLLAVLLNLDGAGFAILLAALLLGTPDPEPDRCRRRGADPGIAARRRVAVAAGAAALHPGAHLRGRGGRRGPGRLRLQGTAADPRRPVPRRAGPLSLGGGGGVAPGPGVDRPWQLLIAPNYGNCAAQRINCRQVDRNR